jgi:hypothetical protein
MQKPLVARRTNSVLVQTVVRKQRCSPKALRNAWIARNGNDLITQGKIEKPLR